MPNPNDIGPKKRPGRPRLAPEKRQSQVIAVTMNLDLYTRIVAAAGSQTLADWAREAFEARLGGASK